MGLKRPHKRFLQPLQPPRRGAGPGAWWIWHWNHTPRQDLGWGRDSCVSLLTQAKPHLMYLICEEEERGCIVPAQQPGQILLSGP